jgi:hypothetical protein
MKEPGDRDTIIEARSLWSLKHDDWTATDSSSNSMSSAASFVTHSIDGSVESRQSAISDDSFTSAPTRSYLVGPAAQLKFLPTTGLGVVSHESESAPALLSAGSRNYSEQTLYTGCEPLVEIIADSTSRLPSFLMSPS